MVCFAYLKRDTKLYNDWKDALCHATYTRKPIIYYSSLIPTMVQKIRKHLNHDPNIYTFRPYPPNPFIFYLKT